MKNILLLTLLMMAGCSGMVSMEALEKEALMTGDWTDVEQRERIIALRDERSGKSCPAGSTSYCEFEFGQEQCQCVETEALSAYYSR